MDDFDLVFNDINICDPNTLNFSTNARDLKNFSALSINVNSFNMSTMNSNHKNANWFIPKLNHVLSNRCSIYLLQDIRLSSNTKSAEKFKKELKCTMHGNYDVYLNSSKGSGGTAILINSSCNYKIINEYRSVCQNIIGLDIIFNNVRFSIFSVYGPRRQANCPDFFQKI